MTLWNNADLSKLAVSTEYRRGHKYFPLVAAFDIETTKAEAPELGGEVSFMYIWKFAIGENIFTGRTWEELRFFLEDIHRELRLATDFKMCVYVQYHKYEFAFYHKFFIIDSGNFVAKSRRDVMRCTVQGVFEFRDAYVYTEKSLDKLGEEVGIPKLKSLDYSLCRHSLTDIKPEEDEYCDNDVKILVKFFTQEAERYGSIAFIPLTATQRVVKELSSNLYAVCKDGKKIKYRLMNAQLDANKEDDMEILRRLRIAFFGGFSFSSPVARGRIYEDCWNADISMSYGTQILLHRFPKKRFEKIQIPARPANKSAADFLKDIVSDMIPAFRNKALLIRIRCKRIEALYPQLAFLPAPAKNYFHRGIELRKRMNFQRVAVCENVDTCLTDIDAYLLTKYYKLEGLEIVEIYGSYYDQLPEYVLNTVFQLAANKKLAQMELEELEAAGKATLQDQAEYIRKKSMVSRLYGVFVQDPIRQNFEYSNEAGEVKPHGFINTESQMDGRKNKALYRPVLYQWGVWVAAWARYEFIEMIMKIGIGESGNDNQKLLAGDTDGFTFCKRSKREDKIISDYNAEKDAELREVCKRYGFDYSLLSGSGQFRLKHFQKFKTIGQKQYAFIDDSGEFDYHCAGLPQQDYREEDGCKVNHGNKYFDQFETADQKLEVFSDSMEIPGSVSKNLKAVYCDKEIVLHNVKDYQGNICEEIRIPSCMILQPTDFHISGSAKGRIKALHDPDRLREVLYKNLGEELAYED